MVLVDVWVFCVYFNQFGSVAVWYGGELLHCVGFLSLKCVTVLDCALWANRQEIDIVPRQNIYMKQKTLDGIRQLVDERKAEGASSSEVNMSSMGAELLEIGLRVTQNMKKKSAGESPEQIFNRMLMEECVKSRVAIQEILTMFFSIQEIKDDSRFSYSSQVEKMKEDVANIVGKAFPKSE